LIIVNLSTHHSGLGSNFLCALVRFIGEKCPVTNVKDGNGVLVIYKDDGTERFRETYKNGKIVED
jgi:hypothetical protein